MHRAIGAEAQRIALAEKMLSLHATESMFHGVRRIGEHCRLTIESVHITFRSDEARGPEPNAHCVITSARVPHVPKLARA
jgi:hypothetical protein